MTHRKKDVTEATRVEVYGRLACCVCSKYLSLCLRMSALGGIKSRSSSGKTSNDLREIKAQSTGERDTALHETNQMNQIKLEE